jgi:biotin synthase-related radical SAM superfamily protein
MQIALQVLQEDIVEYIFARSVRAPVSHMDMVSKLNKCMTILGRG